MTYLSDESNKFYQIRPRYRTFNFHRDKGWTDSLSGYIREADQWSRCVFRNMLLMKRKYRWVVHLNLTDNLSPNDVGPMWLKVTRKLCKKGVEALWVREVNRQNKLHYHILIKDPNNGDAIRRAFDESMPPRKELKWRIRVESVRNQKWICDYLFKAKVQCVNKQGVMVEDLWRAKRLLFRPNLPFHKVGTIGDFWEGGLSKKKMWDRIKEIEIRISEGTGVPNIERLSKYVYDFLGGCVPMLKILRSFRYSHDSADIQRWIDHLVAEEWDDDGADGRE